MPVAGCPLQAGAQRTFAAGTCGISGSLPGARMHCLQGPLSAHHGRRQRCWGHSHPNALRHRLPISQATSCFRGKILTLNSPQERVGLVRQGT